MKDLRIDLSLKEHKAHKRQPVLLINSDAGSLLLAARAREFGVLGSYEDSGRGLNVQRWNYAKVDYRVTPAEWPKQDLTGVLVLAQPPTPASMMRTLKYALGQRCQALALEGPANALTTSWQVHEAAAARHGYQVYRILQNAVTFGTAQWRPRSWAVFISKGAMRWPDLLLHHGPERSVVGHVLEPEGGETAAHHLEAYAQQAQQLAQGYGKKLARELLHGVHGYGLLATLLSRLETTRHPKTAKTTQGLAQEHCIGGSNLGQSLYLLHPDRFSPALRHDSLWAVPGRPLCQLEYKRLMGYPDWYHFPTGPGALEKQNSYLSRGVCPPVAAWLLEELHMNLTAQHRYLAVGRTKRIGRGTLIPETARIAPGQVGNLCLSYQLWEELE